MSYYLRKTLLILVYNEGIVKRASISKVFKISYYTHEILVQGYSRNEAGIKTRYTKKVIGIPIFMRSL
jgi:hypothetical protein